MSGCHCPDLHLSRACTCACHDYFLAQCVRALDRADFERHCRVVAASASSAVAVQTAVRRAVDHGSRSPPDCGVCHVCDEDCLSATVSRASPTAGPLATLFVGGAVLCRRRADGEPCLAPMATLLQLARATDVEASVEIEVESDAALPRHWTLADALPPPEGAPLRMLPVCVRYQDGVPVFERLYVAADGWAALLTDQNLLFAVHDLAARGADSVVGFCAFRKLFGSSFAVRTAAQRAATEALLEDLRARAPAMAICESAARLAELAAQPPSAKLTRDIDLEQRRLHALCTDPREALCAPSAPPVPARFDALAAVKLFYSKASAAPRPSAASLRSAHAVAKRLAAEGMHRDAFRALSLAVEAVDAA